MTAMDIFQRDDLAFPRSLPEFQQRFPDDAACAAYLERTRWPDGFTCRYPFNAFRSLLGIAGGAAAPPYAELYSGDWTHPTCSGCLH